MLSSSPLSVVTDRLFWNFTYYCYTSRIIDILHVLSLYFMYYCYTSCIIAIPNVLSIYFLYYQYTSSIIDMLYVLSIYSTYYRYTSCIDILHVLLIYFTYYWYTSHIIDILLILSIYFTYYRYTSCIIDILHVLLIYFSYYHNGIFRMKVIPSCLSEGCSSYPLLVDLCHHVANLQTCYNNLLSVAFLLCTFFNISSTSLYVETFMAPVVYLHILECLVYFVQISLWLVAVRLQINRMERS
jgi:hypothetical protein